jgi:hypothetical protein
MLYISCDFVCELETRILLAGDLGFIEKGVLGRLKKHRRNRKNIKGADKVCRKQTLNPWPLGSLDPLL